ncbi:MAG: nuclear transport factor 2 family protein [Gammaproteobacteria bacterium]|nr:nuclear transport factor 2 family protein [Gammaproteobacteria bacterium]
MNNENINVVERYYTAMQQHDMIAIENCLHPDILLISPLAEVVGIDAVLA